jgi:hypothetical protein
VDLLIWLFELPIRASRALLLFVAAAPVWLQGILLGVGLGIIAAHVMLWLHEYRSRPPADVVDLDERRRDRP